jgi:hypothetical protein
MRVMRQGVTVFRKLHAWGENKHGELGLGQVRENSSRYEKSSETTVAYVLTVVLSGVESHRAKR